MQLFNRIYLKRRKNAIRLTQKNISLLMIYQRFTWSVRVLSL